MHETIRKQLYKWMISRFNPEDFDEYPPSAESLMSRINVNQYSNKIAELSFSEILDRIELIEKRLDEKDKAKK